MIVASFAAPFALAAVWVSRQCAISPLSLIPCERRVMAYLSDGNLTRGALLPFMRAALPASISMA